MASFGSSASMSRGGSSMGRGRGGGGGAFGGGAFGGAGRGGGSFGGGSAGRGAGTAGGGVSGMMGKMGVTSFGDLLKQCNALEAARHADLPPIKRDFYREAQEIVHLSEERVAAIRAERNNICVEDLGSEARPVPRPIFKFEHAFADYPEILGEIYKQGFAEPSPVQCQVWPIALQGLDVIGIAQTGTGKTLSYLLPAFIHIDSQPTPRAQREGPTCLILTPTRELALQIQDEVNKYHYRGIRSVCVYGGGKRREQLSVCESGVEIVIATPGRLNDFVNAGVIKLSSVTFLILDEADRMLDMGFEPQIKKVLCDVRPDRHSLMTSATWPALVRELAAKYTKNAFLVVVGTLDLTACHNVEQLIYVVQDTDKRPALLAFIKSLGPEDKSLIFVGRKGTADDVCSDLGRLGILCGSLHGDRNQEDREKALKQFRDGTSRLLIATDVASRGLDIQGITHVFNYDFPRDIEDYVHRVGRTGRAGRKGTSVTLVTRYDWRNAESLTNILEEASQEVPDELRRMAEAWARKVERWGPGPGRARFGTSDTGRGTDAQAKDSAPKPNGDKDFVKPTQAQSQSPSSGAASGTFGETAKREDFVRPGRTGLGGRAVGTAGGGGWSGHASERKSAGADGPAINCRAANKSSFVGAFPTQPSGIQGFGNFAPLTSAAVPVAAAKHFDDHVPRIDPRAPQPPTDEDHW